MPRIGLYAVAIILPIATAVGLPLVPPAGPPLEVVSGGSVFPPPPTSFVRQTIGPEAVEHPWITNLKLADLDADGRNDVIACDALRNCVWWYQQTAEGEWIEHSLAADIVAPAHATLVDLDQDGHNDVLVAELGNIWPDDRVVGRVLLL